jgi:WD40 repeat protein
MLSSDDSDEVWTTTSTPNLLLIQFGACLESYLKEGGSLTLLHRMERTRAFFTPSPNDLFLSDDFGGSRMWSEKIGRFKAGLDSTFRSCLAMHPTLPIAAIGGWGVIRIWDFAKGKYLDFLKGHKAEITHLLFQKTNKFTIFW